MHLGSARQKLKLQEIYKHPWYIIHAYVILLELQAGKDTILVHDMAITHGRGIKFNFSECGLAQEFYQAEGRVESMRQNNKRDIADWNIKHVHE